MKIDLSGVAIEENRLDHELIVNGKGLASIQYLDDLRKRSLPHVETIAEGLRLALDLTSDVNCKKADAAVAKCGRPSLLKSKPWFTLSHIRDYLRFRTYLQDTSDFRSVVQHFCHLQSQGIISIVKVDWAKLARPGPFGWRMVAIDIRIAETGMLVEHYMTFGKMIEVNEKWLHKVYEKWRSVAPDRLSMTQLHNFNRDTEFSTHAYREILFDGILREDRAKILQAQRAETSEAILDALTSRFPT